MQRVLVKNTFLDLECAGEKLAPANRRSKSASAACSHQTMTDLEHITVHRLNAVLSTVQAKAPQMHAVECRTKTIGASKLKPVLSNSSISTMAPEDWDSDDFGHTDEDEFLPSAQVVVVPVMPPCEATQERRKSASQISHQSPSEGHAGRRSHIPPVKDFTHARVPKSLNLAEEFSKVKEQAPTTMMIRNIPNRYTQRELIEELESLGFAGSFDFFYAPIDFGTMGNVGYAFVNFIDSSWAARCQQLINGFVFRRHQQKTRKKVATVSVAHLQGLQANIRHYENAAVTGRARSKRCGPVILTSIANAVPL